MLLGRVGLGMAAQRGRLAPRRPRLLDAARARHGAAARRAAGRAMNVDGLADAVVGAEAAYVAGVR